MKRYFFQVVAVAGIFSWAGLAFTSAAHDNSHEKNAFTPDTISWGAAPPVVRPGAQFAVLEGDPTASTGNFTIRLKMPDGFRIAPHWHPNRETVTIISGTFKVGMGDEFDPTLLSSIPTCTTTPWPAEKPLSRSTDNLRFSSTTSILTTTPARVSSRYSRTSGEHANRLRKRQQSLPGPHPSERHGEKPAIKNH